MGISFGSINTGLPKDIVQQIIAAEKIPLTKMEERKQKIVDKKNLVDEIVKLIQDVKSNLVGNNNPKNFRELKSNSNDDLVDVTLDKNVADVGEYQLEIIELAQKSSAMTSGFKDPDDSYVGVGYIQYKLPSGEKRSLYVDSNNSSLTAIKNLINKDPTIGMRANVINDGSSSKTPWRLVLSLDSSGKKNLAEFPYFYFVDGDDDFVIESQREARNAKVKLDGMEIEVPENKLNELIPGITIDLKKAKPGEEFALSIKEDTEAVNLKITEIVEKINKVLSFINNQNKLDERSDTSRTLGGDITLQTVESRIREAILSPIMTNFGEKRVGEIGINFQRDGLLSADTKKIQSVLSQNYLVLAQIFTGSESEDGKKNIGVLEKLGNEINSVIRVPDGSLHLRKRGLETNIDYIDRQIESRQRLLDQKEKTLKDRFSRLEGTISNLKGQGAGLSALSAGMDSTTQLSS